MVLWLKFTLRRVDELRKKPLWLKSLKFVGLSYDPFGDVLSACTRKGSRLPMSIDIEGLMSKEAHTYTHVMAEASRD